MTQDQKKALFVAIVTFVLAVCAIFGYDYGVIKPREQGIVIDFATMVTEAFSNNNNAGDTGDVGDIGEPEFETRAAGNIEIFRALRVLNRLENQGTLEVDGASTLSGAVTVGGGYGDTGCSISAAGVLQCDGAATTAGALTAASAAIGGGYGSTGATISSAGVGQYNGALTTDGALTSDSVVVGGGYGSTGATISTAGVGQFNGALTVDGAAALDGGITVDTTNFTVNGSTGAVVSASSVTADSVALGGGYGSTGATISNAGVGQFNGALTTDGALTSDSVSVGGGYGSTGTTLSNAGNIQANGTLTVDGVTTLSSSLGVAGASVFSSDLRVDPDSTGGNAGAKNEITGLPRIKMVALGTMTNGSTETTSYMDDTPDGEWTAIDADVTVSADTAVYRIGAKSLKLAFADTAADDDGAVIDITNDNLEANESIGFWIYSDTVLDAGDLDILVDDTDATPDLSFDVCAVATANKWTWCEVAISDLAAGNGDVVDKIGIVLKDATTLGAFNVYIDGMYKWDADDEEALGTAILTDGVLSVMSVVAAQDQANTPAMATENTDFFVHYESGNDFIVTITDQSANSGVALVAY